MPESTSSTPAVYPCDRGMPNGPRGYHHFEASPNGIVVCRYCGKVAPRAPAISKGGRWLRDENG